MPGSEVVFTGVESLPEDLIDTLPTRWGKRLGDETRFNEDFAGLRQVHRPQGAKDTVFVDGAKRLIIGKYAGCAFGSNVHFAARSDNPRSAQPPFMEQWADRLAQKNPFVAVVDEEIVGLTEIEPGGSIDYFYVQPKWQNRGVGKALLASLELEAAMLGVSMISADVSVTAKAFFLSRGFRIVEAKTNVILGHPAPNFRMQKAI